YRVSSWSIGLREFFQQSLLSQGGTTVMTQDQLTRRKGRAQSETFVIAQVEDGFRVYAPSNPTRQYVVGGPPEAPTCSCPDFRFHARNGEWRCKHILAVLKETNA